MRKFLIILGSLFTIILLISSSGVAQTWHYGVTVHGSVDCANPDEILDAPDGVYCSIGNGLLLRLGEIVVNLSNTGKMGSNQAFTIFASSTYSEDYSVTIAEDPNFVTSEYLGQDDDLSNANFTTPGKVTSGWQYIKLVGITGDTRADPLYGPDIDAVGWYG